MTEDDAKKAQDLRERLAGAREALKTATSFREKAEKDPRGNKWIEVSFKSEDERWRETWHKLFLPRADIVALLKKREAQAALEVEQAIAMLAGFRP